MAATSADAALGALGRPPASEGTIFWRAANNTLSSASLSPRQSDLDGQREGGRERDLDAGREDVAEAGKGRWNLLMDLSKTSVAGAMNGLASAGVGDGPKGIRLRRGLRNAKDRRWPGASNSSLRSSSARKKLIASSMLVYVVGGASALSWGGGGGQSFGLVMCGSLCVVLQHAPNLIVLINQRFGICALSKSSLLGASRFV